MKVIDQNKALASLELALENHNHLIDSRSEVDRLDFLANFGSILNFYDHTNTINGDWSPFILKDSSFLLATIIKTPFKNMHALFIKTCINLKEAIKKELLNNVRVAFEQLFHQLLHIYHLIERWIYYMLAAPINYNLKNYVIREVKEKYSQYLWGLIWLKQQLYHSKIVGEIKQPNQYFYSDYDKKIWNNPISKTPSWKLLGLNYPFSENSQEDIFKALKEAGETTFSFFKSIIDYAPIQFKEIEDKQDLFPDTLLLKTFTKLMDIYKHQLNGLSNKHLNFYYKDILHQEKLKGTPDTVFICALLSDETTNFKLPKHTLFNAGQYEDDSNILFESIDEVSLTKASINEAYTLTKYTTETGNTKLYLKTQEEVTTVLENEEGNTESWKTFGTQKSKQGEEVTLGFVIASPILHVREGYRIIKLEFTFQKEIENLTFFKEGSYTLSTAEAWLELNKSNLKIHHKEEKKKVCFEITLLETDPAILPFIENEEELATEWPMFKMAFSEFLVNGMQLVIEKVTIDVEVQDLQNFQLYNDFGLLESEKPFLPLGPTPEKDQSFFIGNAEVFSKPLNDFSIRMNWDNLPESFTQYYYQYNKYESNVYGKMVEARNETFPTKVEKEGAKKQKENKGIWNKVVSFLKGRRNTEEEVFELVQYNEPFNDTAFKVKFSLLDRKRWIPLVIEYTAPVFYGICKEKANDVKNLFQGIPNVFLEDEKEKASKSIKIKTDIYIEEMLKLDCAFSTEIQLGFYQNTIVFNEEVILEGLLKLDNRLDINAVLKIKDQLTMKELLENIENLYITDVFEIKYHLKAKDIIKINSELKLRETLELETSLKDKKLVLEGESLEKVNLEIKEGIEISDVKKLNDIIELDDSILLKDVLKGKQKAIFRIKKNLQFYELFTEQLFDFEKKIRVTCQGKIYLNNSKNEAQIKSFEGYLMINGIVKMDTVVSLQQAISINKFIETDCSLDESLLDMFPYSLFGATEIRKLQKGINPYLQNKPLEFTEESTSGFVKMQLVAPKYGFGNVLYPKVVSAIALYNAQEIAKVFKGEKSNIETEANEPYSPVIGLFKGSYKSSISYDFTTTKNDYPVTCFYIDTFKNYKVYDSTFSIKENAKIENVFPSLLPQYLSEGNLLLALENVRTPTKVSFYFELVQDTIETKNNKEHISYQYLGKEGWEKLPVISDSTNGFSCSGIITFNIPFNCTDNGYTMPNNKNWISIKVSNSPDKYCKTSFLNLNGVALQRTGTRFKTTTVKPKIAANTIESTYASVPEIAIIQQPFASFGGSTYETTKAFHKRTSIRLKTKDRAVTNEDYYRMVLETFPEIYYSKQVYNAATKTTEVYIVKQVANSSISNAFMPLVHQCLKEKVASFLKSRTSAFANVVINNFKLQYVKVKGNVTVDSETSPEGIAKEINAGIQVFLSPWIKSNQRQITIDTGLNANQVSEFIASYPQVIAVSNIEIYLINKQEKTIEGPFQSVESKDFLLVPSLENQEIIYK